MQLTGILLLDKPEGISSNAALQRTRRLLGGVKAGHVGSLDPLATGMLPICLGEATKIAGEILAGRKLYRFSIRLGTRTTTGDREGAIAESMPVPTLDRSRIEAVLAQFRGEQMQTPPMFSALKQQGQPLYRLARAGIEVERQARSIQITELQLLSVEPDLLQLEVLCSKGTYVRTLAEDIAASLGTRGHVNSLRRVHVEPFGGFPMETLETLALAHERGTLPPVLAPEVGLQHLGAVRLDRDEVVAQIRHGRAVAITTAAVNAGIGPAGARVRLYDAGGQFIGIGELADAGIVKPRRLFLLPAN